MKNSSTKQDDQIDDTEKTIPLPSSSSSISAGSEEDSEVLGAVGPAVHAHVAIIKPKPTTAVQSKTKFIPIRENKPVSSLPFDVPTSSIVNKLLRIIEDMPDPADKSVISTPKSLKVSLKSHQQYGLKWLWYVFSIFFAFAVLTLTLLFAR